MPIFDNLRGLVPLPTSRNSQSTAPIDTDNIRLEQDLRGISNGVFSPEFPIPLPIVPEIDVSNTFVDDIYTRINDVFEYIQLPTPEFLQDIYGVTQQIENVINDPISTVRNEIQKNLYDLLHPKEKNIFPVDRMKSYSKSEEIKSLDLINGTTGFRAPLVKESLASTERLSTGEDISRIDEPELIRSFKGRESLKDVTLRSIDLWDIQIEPFEYNGIPNLWVPPIQQSDNAAVNLTSKYGNLFPKVIPSVTDYMPILSYDLDLKTLTTKQLDLYGGSSIAVPDLIRYTSQMSLQIVDDENKRWRRWFQTYSENLYNQDDNSVAPYKNSSLLITLYQYRQDHKILSHNQYICSLSNYQMISSGAGMASTDVLDIELSIVGRIELPSNYSYLEIV